MLSSLGLEQLSLDTQMNSKENREKILLRRQRRRRPRGVGRETNEGE